MLQVMVTGEEEARVRQGMTLTKLNGECCAQCLQLVDPADKCDCDTCVHARTHAQTPGELVRNGLPAATDLSAPITKPIAQAATPSLPRYLELVLLALALLLMPA